MGSRPTVDAAGAKCAVQSSSLRIAAKGVHPPSSPSRMTRSNCSAKGRFVPLIISTEGLVGLDKLL